MSSCHLPIVQTQDDWAETAYFKTFCAEEGMSIYFATCNCKIRKISPTPASGKPSAGIKVKKDRPCPIALSLAGFHSRRDRLITSSIQRVISSSLSLASRVGRNFTVSSLSPTWTKKPPSAILHSKGELPMFKILSNLS